MTQIPNDKLIHYKTILILDDNESDENQKLIPPVQNVQQDLSYSTNQKCNKYIVYPIVGSISFLIIVIILIFFISKEL